jgi:hypothetical protein
MRIVTTSAASPRLGGQAKLPQKQWDGTQDPLERLTKPEKVADSFIVITQA